MRDWTASTLKERLDHVREINGGVSQNRLGAEAGIEGGPMSKLMTRPRPSAEKLAAIASRWGVSLLWLTTGTGQPRGDGTPDDAPGQGADLAPFDEAARFARANGAPEWAIERVRTRAARLVRDRTPNDYWMMIQGAVADGEDEAAVADVGHAPAPGDIAAPRRGRK